VCTACQRGWSSDDAIGVEAVRSLDGVKDGVCWGPYVALPFTGHGSASRFSVGELALTMMELLRWKHVWFYGVGGFRGQSLCLNLLLAKRKPRVWVLPARGL
jgi:hypothetical protein